MKKVVVLRDIDIDGKATLGTCIVYDGDKQLFKSECLERGWVNNMRNISCIPTGIYPLQLEYSPRFKKELWEVKDVPGRSECKFHSANYWRQLNGCLALGKERLYIDSDNILDVTDSRDTMDLFHEALEGDICAELQVFNVLDLLL
jgi:hypothetical protein